MIRTLQNRSVTVGYFNITLKFWTQEFKCILAYHVVDLELKVIHIQKYLLIELINE